MDKEGGREGKRGYNISTGREGLLCRKNSWVLVWGWKKLQRERLKDCSTGRRTTTTKTTTATTTTTTTTTREMKKKMEENKEDNRTSICYYKQQIGSKIFE